MSASFRRFVRNWQNQAQLQLATTSVLIGTFSVLVISLTLYTNVTSSMQVAGNDIHMTAYLTDDLGEQNLQKLLQAVESEKGVDQVNYVSKAVAIEQFKEQMVDHLPQFFFENDFENPLPSSLEIILKEGLVEAEGGEIKALADSLSQFTGIEDVSFGFAWAKEFSQLTQAVRFSGLFLILILLVGGLFVIGNSVSQSIYQKRDEIELLELFGATRKSILVPFVVEGALTGAIAGVVALLISFGALYWLKAILKSEASIFAFAQGWSFLPPSLIAISVLAATLLGALGAFVFVHKITTGWAAAQRGVH